jgi:hypothetical protein
VRVKWWSWHYWIGKRVVEITDYTFDDERVYYTEKEYALKILEAKCSEKVRPS